MIEGRSRTTIWIVAGIVAGILIYLLRDVLLPFVAGFAVAYMLDPAVRHLMRLRLPRGAASAVALALFFLAAVSLLLMTLPILQSQIATFAQRLPSYVERLRTLVEPLFQVLRDRAGIPDVSDLSTLAGKHAAQALGWFGTVIAGLVSGGAAIVGTLSLLLITPVVAFYLLRDWHKVVERIDLWLPRTEAETIRAQLREIDQTLAGFARGQALVCFVLALYYAIGLTLCGLDFGILVGVFTGIASFIPVVGALAGGVLSIGLALIQFPTWGPVVAAAVVFGLGQVLEGQFLTPRLVGDRVRLHPVWIIFALMTGGTLFGFVGLLLAVPVAAAVGVLARFAVARYLGSPFYRGHHE
jgi:predicted PurR-regulated permease PerM